MDRYERGETIAQGGHGVILRCVDRHTNASFVMKSIAYKSKDEGVPCAVIREISVLKELDHDNIVRLLNVVDDNDGFHLVFEEMSFDLYDFIHDPSNAELGQHVIKRFLFQILQGVSYCHSRKVLHRDLKPQNLLVDSNRKTVKLADFGLARTIDVPLPHYTTKVVSFAYKAPELLLHMPYSAAVDIWSVGCIFAEMVKKEVLFNEVYEADIMYQINRKLGLPDEKDWPGITLACCELYETDMLPDLPPLQPLSEIVPHLEEQGIDLLSKMLKVNPKERITAYEALKHPYFDDLQVNP